MALHPVNSTGRRPPHYLIYHHLLSRRRRVRTNRTTPFIFFLFLPSFLFLLILFHFNPLLLLSCLIRPLCLIYCTQSIFSFISSSNAFSCHQKLLLSHAPLMSHSTFSICVQHAKPSCPKSFLTLPKHETGLW